MNDVAKEPPLPEKPRHSHTSEEIHETEKELMQRLGELRQSLRERRDVVDRLTTGEKVADSVASVMGSWKFIIVQSLILLAWVALNITGWMRAWDPYPFILLNLALSFQAAYAAPIIMMSQNRQASIDRAAAEHDYQVNMKAELEIELLHHKLDQLRSREVRALGRAVDELCGHLAAARARDGGE